ncbi:MAG: response regulator transcription factor [Saprospiraceae bacterium]|jgi:DNA-binding NarL/FixJ family response regulator|nr:response regulator transcription factor [Saprospiraceae bacterium]
MNPVKVIFIDRQKMFVQGIMALADKIKYPVIKIAGQYSVTKYFLEDYDGGADIIAVDLNLEDSDGIDFIAQLRSDFPDQKVMVLSSYAEYKFVKDAMKKGADGYILKTADYSEFGNCIIDIMQGKTFLGSGVYLTPPVTVYKREFSSSTRRVMNEDRFQIKQKLTKRELEILRLIIQAKTNDEIGDQLFISHQTVGVHKKNIMRKLGMKSTMTLIKYAIENELV